MSYADIAALSNDAEFRSRLTACLTSESALKTDELSNVILKSPQYGAQLFMPLVAAAPGFADKFAADGQESIVDGDILSAVQASWERVATLLATPGTP